MAKRTRSSRSAGVKGRDIAAYEAKRDFDRTPEPAAETQATDFGRLFVIQKHDATNLHYDLRLELDGVLLSWAVPKGPSLDPTVKSLAVHVEDHPVAYGSFEGVIPPGEYGGGAVMLWDRGEWEPINEPHEALKRGDLKFRLYGEKLGGAWALVRMGGRKGDDKNWLLIKKKDGAAKARHVYDVVRNAPDSVTTGRTIEQIAEDADRVWKDGHAQEGKTATVRDGEPRVRSRLDPSGLPEAKLSKMPATIKPQLCTAQSEPPIGPQWVHELKYDGYRLMARLEGGAVTLLTRNGHDWTDRFEPVARALARLAVHDAILDGEVCVLDARGLPSFSALQKSLDRRDRSGFVYYVFDMPYARGFDLTRTPLVERKAYLERVLMASAGIAPIVQYAQHLDAPGDVVAREARAGGAEGIISKKRDARYVQERSQNWVKVRFVNREEFVVGGYTRPEGSRSAFGALVLGRYDATGRLVHCGRVGTGFSEQALAELLAAMKPLVRSATPFANPPTGAEARDVTWIEPVLVVEVEYAAWTHDEMLRHPAFVGLRRDKQARDVIAMAPPSKSRPGQASGAHVVRIGKAPADARIGGVRISNPDRIVYPVTGTTKGDVARYYDAVAAHMLPHIAKRPLSLVRCPTGVEGERFYQRHVGEGFPADIKGITIDEAGDTKDHVMITTKKGLLSLIQMGVLEIHPWGSRADDIEKPDRLIFDLDPGPGIEWEAIVHSALAVRDYLDALGLVSFVKTSGGKGIHVVVPITRRPGWDDVKRFTHHVATELVRIAPRNFVATISKKARPGKVLIDYLRNQRSATAVGAYSTRARETPTVSTPLAWEELVTTAGPGQFTVDTLPDRLATLPEDPWAQIGKVRQGLPKGWD